MNRRIANKIKKRITAMVSCPRKNGRGYTEGQRRRACQILHPHAQLSLKLKDISEAAEGASLGVQAVAAAMKYLDEALRKAVLPNVECTADPNDPLKVFIKISNVPLEWFLGKSAAALRAGRFIVPDNVPDCATIKRQADGRVAFEWVEVDFILTPTGAEFPKP